MTGFLCLFLPVLQSDPSRLKNLLRPADPSKINQRPLASYLAVLLLPKHFSTVRSTQTCAELVYLATVNTATDPRAEVSHFFSVKASKLFYFEPASKTSDHPQIDVQPMFSQQTFCGAKSCTLSLSKPEKSSESCNVVVGGVL